MSTALKRIQPRLIPSAKAPLPLIRKTANSLPLAPPASTPASPSWLPARLPSHTQPLHITIANVILFNSKSVVLLPGWKHSSESPFHSEWKAKSSPWPTRPSRSRLPGLLASYPSPYSLYMDHAGPLAIPPPGQARSPSARALFLQLPMSLTPSPLANLHSNTASLLRPARPHHGQQQPRASPLAGPHPALVSVCPEHTS